MRTHYIMISHKCIHLKQILKFCSIYCAEENSIVLYSGLTFVQQPSVSKCLFTVMLLTIMIYIR
jgi:hypothetical protein